MPAGSLVLAAILLIVVFTGCYVLLLWLADPHEREPINHLVVMLTLGAAVAPILTRLAEAAFGLPDSIFPPALQRYVVVPLSPWTGLVEEAAKSVLVLGVFVSARRAFRDTLDGVVVGATVGAGFALAESLAYVRELAAVAQIAGLAPGPLFGLLVGGLSQCLFTSLFGASLGYVRGAAPRMWILPVAGFGAAVLSHMGYIGSTGHAAGIVRGVADWGGMLLILVVMGWGWERERYVFRQMLAGETAVGTVTVEELTRLTTAHRLARPFQALRAAGRPRYRATRSLQRTQTALAFTKWRRAHDLGTDRDVENARDAVRRARALLDD
ncbi:MAG TPA: PrsW family glutamic-type intramembrane protease [bacterium]|nr:PrsW family glutamic-type intramembrane protease [bacterium]